MNAKTSCLAIVVALGFLAPSAKSDKPKKYVLSIGSVSTVAGEELKPGNYNLVVDTHDPKVRFHNVSSGGDIEVEAKIETSEEKVENTMIHFSRENGAARITEIRLAGTKTRLIFE